MSLEGYCISLSGLFPMRPLCGGERGENMILGRLLMGISTFAFTIFRFLLSYLRKNLTILVVLSNSYPPSWNFNFHRTPIDSKIDFLERFISSLTPVHFSPSIADSRVWPLSFLTHLGLPLRLMLFGVLWLQNFAEIGWMTRSLFVFKRVE